MTVLTILRSSIHRLFTITLAIKITTLVGIRLLASKLGTYEAAVIVKGLWSVNDFTSQTDLLGIKASGHACIVCDVKFAIDPRPFLLGHKQVVIGFS